MRPPFNPSETLWCAQIAGYGDPAFDREHADFAAKVREYDLTRHPADLAVVPLQPLAKLTLWKLRPLTAAERTDVNGCATDDLRRFMAFRFAVVARIDAAEIAADGTVTGTEVPASMMAGGRMTDDAWLAACVVVAGGGIVDELGEIARRRATVHPKAPRPYALPRSLVEELRASG